MNQDKNKEMSKWVLMFVFILVVPFSVIIGAPLLLGFPAAYSPILIFVSCVVSAALAKRFLKKL